ncbi:hypothetical protein [Stratiformator vulcanicus]|uniref:Uncharacterized protein n=1 Tax=Stratiformator vulcanicus TaxID=2527980 RepID=A0A517R6L2_9PLAN|nr:hypothetical protein [Stratiformator vulcanicus]QDT39482.1 hypothetical protein Pan189_38900 [Stratiformator vulcanicus]
MNRKSQRPVDYLRLFPWLRLFRAFGLALDPKKMFLGGVSLLLIVLGHWGIGALLLTPAQQGSDSLRDLTGASQFLEQPRTAFPISGVNHGVVRMLRGGRTSEISGPQTLRLAFPYLSLLKPAAVAALPGQTGRQRTAAILGLCWSVLIWTLFGSILCRMTALEFAAGGGVGIFSGSGFGLRKWFANISAIILPISGLVLAALFCAAIGLLARIPAAGPWIAAVLYGLAMLAGGFSLLILYGLLPGWPLMVATISVEGSDAFDGFSRTYSYLLARPWLAIWCVLVALLFGIISLTVVELAGSALLWVTDRFVLVGGGSAAEPLLTRHEPFYQATDGSPTTSHPAAGFWSGLVQFFVAGYGVAYFWSAATLIYFILRRSDDGTYFDEVFVEDEPEDEGLPLSGIAATDVAMPERSHHPTVERPDDSNV